MHPRTIPPSLVALAEIAPVVGDGALAQIIEIVSDWLVWGEALRDIRDGHPDPARRAREALEAPRAKEVGR